MKTYVIAGHFDQETENKVLEIWKQLNEKGISDYGYVYENRLPHITFVDFEMASSEKAIELLKSIDFGKVDLKITSVANFLGTETLYYDILASKSLKGLHKSLENVFYDYMPKDSFYQSGHWRPHTTVASRLDSKAMEKAFNMAKKLEFHDAKIDSLVLLEIESHNKVHTICELKDGTDHSGTIAN